jgi:membrane protease YdiL (CAAX protease family)
MKQIVIWFARIWTIVWKTGLFFILWGLLLVPIIVPFAAKFEQIRPTYPLQLQLFSEVSIALTLLAVAWFMAHFIDHRSFRTLGFSTDHWMSDLLLGVSLGAVWLALSVAFLWFAGCVQVQSAVVMSGSFLAWTASALIFNTVAQEVLARSYIFQTIRSQTNAAASVIVTAVLFMAYHAGAYQGSWLAALNVFLAGILFGMAYQLTGNLWLPIGIHFIWNFLLGPVLGLTVSGNSQTWSRTQLLTVQGPAWLTGGAFGLEGGLAVTLTTLLSIAVLIVFFPGGRLIVRS